MHRDGAELRPGGDLGKCTEHVTGNSEAKAQGSWFSSQGASPPLYHKALSLTIEHGLHMQKLPEILLLPWTKLFYCLALGVICKISRLGDL